MKKKGKRAKGIDATPSEMHGGRRGGSRGGRSPRPGKRKIWKVGKRELRKKTQRIARGSSTTGFSRQGRQAQLRRRGSREARQKKSGFGRTLRKTTGRPKRQKGLGIIPIYLRNLQGYDIYRDFWGHGAEKNNKATSEEPKKHLLGVSKESLYPAKGTGKKQAEQ